MFGLTEGNLNRLQFNSEPIFFSFDYVGHPELFGLIVYLDEYATPEEVNADLERVKLHALPFLDDAHGVTPETLRMFPIARSIMQEFRNTPYWAYKTAVPIWHPNDQQMFFAGKTEHDMAAYLEEAGLIGPTTKRTSKGFEKGFGKRSGENG